MTKNQLDYFVAAAESLSFTKAAAQFYISQTAITQQIRALEESLGCTLFDRSRRPISLTPAGSTFLIEAKAILERMNIAVSRAHEASTGLVGALNLGYIKGYERSELSNHLKRFHRQYSNVLVSCYRSSADELATKLMQQEYDVIFTSGRSKLRQDPAVKFRLVERARLVAALYLSHPFAQRNSISRSELKGEKMLYMSQSAEVDTYEESDIMQLYQNAGFKPEILFHSSDVESILMMVAAEEGIAILPDYCTRKLTNADNLIFVPLEGEEETELIYAIWRKDNQSSALQRYVQTL